jgi:hypothetical protein
MKKAILIIAAIFVGLIILSALLDSEETTQAPEQKKTEEKTKNTDEEFARKAFVISQDFVKRQLTSPKSADFPFLDYSYSNVIDNIITIESYVDSKNSFNAEMRNNFRIKLKFKGGDWSDVNNWTVLGLDFY